MATLEVREVSPGRWEWRRGGQIVGHLSRNNSGGIDSTDAESDPDRVTAMMMAANGIEEWDIAAHRSVE